LADFCDFLQVRRRAVNHQRQSPTARQFVEALTDGGPECQGFFAQDMTPGLQRRLNEFGMRFSGGGDQEGVHILAS